MIDELIIVGFGLWFIEGKRARPVSDQDLWLELSSPGSPRDSAKTRRPSHSKSLAKINQSKASSLTFLVFRSLPYNTSKV